MNVIITGASRGIGKAIAEKFGSAGYDLILCARQEEVLEDMATGIQKKHPKIKVLFKACDVSRREEVSAFAAWLLTETDSVDILVNNAGGFIQGNIQDEPEGNLEQLMNTNLYSAYWLTRDVIGAIKNGGSGHIFNICSIASLKSYPNGGAYSITKYALAGFSANLRQELMPFGVKVTSVFPGAVWTSSWSGSGVAEDRIMQASDIAEMIFSAANLSPQACVEEIVIRPQLGDL